EGLKEALDLINELRHCLHMVLYPEMASPTCTPSKVIERVMSQAESLLEKYSNTPLEALKMVKRRPTTLEDAQNMLAESKRCISGLMYHLRKAGKTQEADDIARTYKLEPEPTVV